MAGIVSDNNHQLEETKELHCVYGDQEFVLEDTGGMYCSDDTKAIYYLTDSQTILFHDVDNQLTSYYIDENSEILGNQNETLMVDGTEIVQLIQGNDDDDQQLLQTQQPQEQEQQEDDQQIIYYTDDNTNIDNIETTTTTNNIISSLQDVDGNIYPLKHLMLEGPIFEYDDDDDDDDDDGDDDNDAKIDLNNHNIEYAIIQDNTTTINEQQEHEQQQKQQILTANDNDIIDLSKITGRNLITGQTVTLHSYMEKLKRKLNTDSINDLYKKSTNYIKNDKKSSSTTTTTTIDGLLDKKIPIGTTKNGKKIVGKIVHIGKKSDSDDDNDNNNNNNDNVDNNKIKKPIIITEGNLEQISKTLSGVMGMESVCKKLENKNLIIKLIERNYIINNNNIDDNNNYYQRKTSFCYGYMWKFDNNLWKFITTTTIENESKFPTTTSLTIVITTNKNGSKSVRVNLNNLANNLCNLCMKQFKNIQQLHQHLLTIHNQLNDGQKQILLCEICGEINENLDKLLAHKSTHNHNNNNDNNSKLFVCNECNKCFTTQQRLQKHLQIHNLYLRPLECTICKLRCSNEWTLKKHLLNHTGIKPYSCDVCNKQFTNEYDVNFHKRIHYPDKQYTCDVCMRTFSRHSNLLRHTQIHKSALYTCEICDCSYNYMSSLTRHMVQSHIDVKDSRKRIKKQHA